MSAFAAALAGAITAVGVGSVTVARSWPAPTGRHRATTRPATARGAIGAGRALQPMHGQPIEEDPVLPLAEDGRR
ncbi:hypothetical protein [Streptomyces sp. BBFR109]|uniref:hypothetical protein n=1 Tax=Streptomyces sp. BBFR109 TaxID=3448172 RepID=UPI003F761AC9